MRVQEKNRTPLGIELQQSNSRTQRRARARAEARGATPDASRSGIASPRLEPRGPCRGPVFRGRPARRRARRAAARAIRAREERARARGRVRRDASQRARHGRRRLSTREQAIRFRHRLARRACPRERPTGQVKPRRVSPRPSRSERSRRPRCRDARFAFASPRAVRRRALLSRARGRCYHQADSTQRPPQPRAIEHQFVLFFFDASSVLAVLEKDKRCDWWKIGGRRIWTSGDQFSATSTLQVARGGKIRTALPRALRLARTSHDELREHGGSHEFRRGFARGRDRERAPAQARGLDQHESYLTVRPV